MSIASFIASLFHVQTAARRKAIEAAILADDWLLYCAQDAMGGTYGLKFDRWWSMAKFSISVTTRFAKANPGERLPLKAEIGEVLRQIVQEGAHQVYLVDNPAPPGSAVTGGSVMKRRDW